MFQYVKSRGGVHEHEARWFFQQLIIGADGCFCCFMRRQLLVLVPRALASCHWAQGWNAQHLICCVTGLDYCHRMGVVNRDIKLENTLLDGSKRPLVKICDFGYSKSEKDSLPKSKVGTPGYTGERC